jgi:hypothetical protein
LDFAVQGLLQGSHDVVTVGIDIHQAGQKKGQADHNGTQGQEEQA